MEKYLIMAGLMIASAVAIPKMVEQKLGSEPNSAPTPQQVAVQPTKKSPRINPLDGRKAVLSMDSRGHFNVDARLNGRRAEVLVDTGATYVAINETTARKIGIRLKDSDFKYKVRTANGITLVASAMIDEIEIGRVRVKNVQASVSKDSSLSTTLLGMSFLKKLDKFEVSGNKLILSQ